MSRIDVRSALAALLLLCAACTAEYQPHGPAVTEPRLGDDHLITADNYRLHLKRTMPIDPVRAIAVALHGFNDYNHAWAEPAARWARDGIATYAYDQRGFGRNLKPGIWAGVPTLQQDLRTVIKLVRQKHPDTPIFLVGESMGGAVVMSMLGGPKPPDVQGAILAAPAVWARQTMSGPLQGLLSGARSLIPGAVLRGDGLGRQASDNIEMLRDLGRDPLVIKGARVDALDGLVNLMDAAYVAAAGIRTPILVLYGIKDQIVPLESVQQTIGLFTHAPDIAVYSDGWHLLFRDFNGPIVQGDAAHWMLNGGPALPSNAHLKAAAIRPADQTIARGN